MEITVTNLTIDDIARTIREELKAYFEAQEKAAAKEDELGGIGLAMKITGLAKPTIYALVSERKIPHSKRGRKLYFSRQELLEWLASGKRRTISEIAKEVISK